MSQVSVTKEKSPAKQETPAFRPFIPMFPFGRFFGLSPFGMMRSPERGVQRSTSSNQAGMTAELPGLKKEEVKVELSNEALVIKGERRSEHKEEREGFYKSERSYGQFYRSIRLPEGAKTDQAKAELNDGVLKVSVPVLESKKTVRQIPVEQGKEAKPAAAKEAA